MIKLNNLFVYASLLLVTLNLCFSKPTLTNGTNDNNDSEADETSTSNVNEINDILGVNSATSNIISSKDETYRRHYAAQMLSYMNRSILPCDDFFEYACGNWKNEIEEHQAANKRNNILEITYKLADIVENILQRPNINDVAPEYAEEFELAKNFYGKCLEADLHPMRASQDYLNVLKEIGGFPAVDPAWKEVQFNWLNMSAHLSNYGIKSLVNEVLLPEYPFPPFFKNPEFGFDIELRSDTLQNTTSNAYKENEKRMRKILTTYGVEESHLNSIISEIFDFLLEILKLQEEFNEDEHECKFLSALMEGSELEAISEQWQAYNEIAWLGQKWGNHSEDIEDCCSPCAYLYGKVDRICREHKRAAANYLSLKFLYHMDSRIGDTKFQKEFCVLSIQSSMKFFFDHLYMQLYFSDELREEVLTLLKEIRKSLRIVLEEADWLDEATRNAALLKESTIGLHIGRCENMNLTKQLISEIKNLQFVNGSYEANYLNLRKFRQYMSRYNGLNFEKISNDSKPLDLYVAMQVNAFYYNIDNSIYVMAGTLLPPVYHKAWPNSLKYGTLGYLIGHEFTHGFDTVGAGFDENGQTNYWWSNKSSRVFRERSNCYADHYQSYVIPEINRNINGNLTKDENIADSGGLREAFMAYRRYLKNVTKELDSISAVYKEEQMPGLDLTPEQLFFLGFAQVWCSSYKEADYWEELTNEHAIDKYRVLGALSNNQDFAKAFSCPVGSKMNPSSDKCQVW